MNKQFETTSPRLNQFIVQAMEKHQVPGVVVGILQDGETAVFPFGITNVEHPLPVTETTLFQVGSISKTFTAISSPSFRCLAL